jgi:hypothetical protein
VVGAIKWGISEPYPSKRPKWITNQTRRQLWPTGRCIAGVAATAGNQDRRSEEECHVLVWRADFKGAREIMRRVVWEIVRCQASAAVGIISVGTDGEVVFDRAPVSDQ